MQSSIYYDIMAIKFAYWIFQFEICKNDIDSFSWVLLEDFKTWFLFFKYI